MSSLNVEIPAIVIFAHSPQRTSFPAILLLMFDSLNQNQLCLLVKRQTNNHSPGPGTKFVISKTTVIILRTNMRGKIRNGLNFENSENNLAV